MFQKGCKHLRFAARKAVTLDWRPKQGPCLTGKASWGKDDAGGRIFSRAYLVGSMVNVHTIQSIQCCINAAASSPGSDRKSLGGDKNGMSKHWGTVLQRLLQRWRMMACFHARTIGPGLYASAPGSSILECVTYNHHQPGAIFYYRLLRKFSITPCPIYGPF